ncbi:MAG: tetratricopeptide repeat protein [Acidobacteriota bacterium]
MKRTIRVAAILMGISLAALLQAASSARLMGTITDAEGHPMEGVTILVTTPSLTNFKLTLKSDKNGKYSTIINDATLPYHVHIEKEGFAPFDVDKKIPIGDSFILDTKLLSGSAPAPKAGSAAAPAAAPSDSNQAIVAFNSGVDAINAGDKAGAETQFLDAVKKNPDLSAGWQALTQLAYEKKDWAKTLEYGKKATDLDPSQSGLYPMLAEAAKQTGNTQAQSDWNAKNAEANPEASANALYNSGVAAYNKGKMKEAEASLSKAVEARPDFANAHFWLGMAAFNQNKKAVAKEHLAKYLELDPSGKEAATAQEILPLVK